MQAMQHETESAFIKRALNSEIERLMTELETANMKTALLAVAQDELQQEVNFWRQQAAELQQRLLDNESRDDDDDDDDDEDEEDDDEDEEDDEEDEDEVEEAAEVERIENDGARMEQ